jgi:adenylylsulfate kinase
MIILLTGLSGAGKSTLSHYAKLQLLTLGIDVEIIDGDEYREKICKNLTFSKADRIENIRRLGFIANKFSARGITTIISAISPYNEARQELIDNYDNVKVVHIDCPVNQLINRDTKGLYKRALLPTGHPDKINNLTGVNDNYDVPAKPDLYINTNEKSLQKCVDDFTFFIMNHQYIPLQNNVNELAQLSF